MFLSVVSASCAPQWVSASLGEMSICTNSRVYDVLAKGRVVAGSRVIERRVDFSPNRLWYTQMAINVERLELSETETRVELVVPAPIERNAIAGVDVVSKDVWVFMRHASDLDDRSRLFFSGLGDLGSVEADGIVRFPTARFSSESEFVDRVRAARSRPECAFDETIVLGR